jgi:uncharacterized phage protein gp47/JayE
VLPSRVDLQQVFSRSILSAALARINPAIVNVAGSDLNLIAGAASTMGEEISAQVAGCLESLWSDTATGDALDRLAGDRYSLTRLGATPSTVTLTFSRPTFAAGAGTISAGSRVQTAAGTQFATDVDASFGATDITVDVTATALIVGPDANVSPEQITSVVDSLFDATIVVTNHSWSAGGTDVETDPAFRSRIRDFFSSLRRGTLGAIEFGARQVAGVAVATAIEIVNGNGFPAAAVQLIIGDAAGNASGTMLQEVRDVLETWRAGGIQVYVISGTAIFQPVEWHLAIDTGFDQQQALAEVTAVTVAVSQFLRPGETLYRATLLAAARTVPGVIITADSLRLPLADTTPITTNLLIRVRPTDVSYV